MNKKISAALLICAPILIAAAVIIFLFKTEEDLNSGGRKIPPGEAVKEISDAEGRQDESPGPQEADIKRLDVQTGEGREGELVFSFSLDDFIESFNSCLNSGKEEDCLSPSYMWSSYTCGPSIHSEHESVLYSFSGDEEIWSYPTVEAYTPTDKPGVLEIVLSFDDHGYTDYLYGKYEELCFYTLKVFFPDFEDDRLVELCKELISLAYEYFPEEHDFSYGAVPSVLYYADGVGLYPYFADGGTVKLCVIPVTDSVLRDFEVKGTVLNEVA